MPTVNNKTEMDKFNITENTIFPILKELNISKSPGPDEISTRLLMELSDVICHPLCKIFETSLKHLAFLMIGAAIYKIGNKKIVCNYRSISLTSIVCKCMDIFFQKSCYRYMKENGLFSPKQYGFISGRYTFL